MSSAEKIESRVRNACNAVERAMSELQSEAEKGLVRPEEAKRVLHDTFEMLKLAANSLDQRRLSLGRIYGPRVATDTTWK